jgi:hypothetical protein
MDFLEFVVILMGIATVLSLVGVLISLSDLFRKDHHQKPYESRLNKAHKRA